MDAAATDGAPDSPPAGPVLRTEPTQIEAAAEVGPAGAAPASGAAGASRAWPGEVGAAEVAMGADEVDDEALLALVLATCYLRFATYKTTTRCSTAYYFLGG